MCRCENYFVDGQGKPPCDGFVRECGNWLHGVIPPAWTVTFFRWREWPDGEDFHARYVLTDVGGLRIDAGLDEAPGQTTVVAHMEIALIQERLKSLEPGAKVYDLIGPVVRVSSNGYVEET